MVLAQHILGIENIQLLRPPLNMGDFWSAQNDAILLSLDDRDPHEFLRVFLNSTELHYKKLETSSQPLDFEDLDDS